MQRMMWSIEDKRKVKGGRQRQMKGKKETEEEEVQCKAT